ncbi:hypothetical protein F5Y19DRAFT_297796 [Xylariaceae sp. FL1651]|nr:hypothetical protein F5Y19DRAFT_297796 [Xylariaceae sp. FL1651]
MANQQAPTPQVTEVYDKMRGFLKGTHWSKPYYSSLMHNNPQLPYHLLEHVNCTYMSTPGRAPTLLALKQHAQSLAVLISLLAPAQYGGTLDPPNEGHHQGDAAFAAEQAFDWLNNLQVHYHTEDGAHKKPLNALTNLVKSNSDTEGPKFHCPLDTTGIDFPEKHPFQQYRPYETHMTLLMHANEILERLDHEYSAMGGILGIIPLDSDHVEEQRALTQAKTTLVGQWILHTQHLVVRMHELEIAYGNCLDLLANEAVVPLQHISVHGPDGRSGREIIFPQDRWILANAGEDVFNFIHQMLDRAEAHQNDRDDIYADQRVLGDAAFASNDDSKYRGIVKVDLNTRFYRLRNSGHGPLFVLPAFADRPNTKYTRDIENRPTVITIPQPSSKESVSAWESKHKDVDAQLIKLHIDNSNLEANISSLKVSVDVRDREIERMVKIQEQYDDKLNKKDMDQAQEIVRLKEHIQYFQKMLDDSKQRENALEEDLETFKKANIHVQNGQDPVPPLVAKISSQEQEIRNLKKEMQKRDRKIDDLERDNDTLRVINHGGFRDLLAPTPQQPASQQVTDLQAQLSSCQQERQKLHQELLTVKKSKAVRGKILNFPAGFKLDYGSTFEDSNQGITACSTQYYKSLLAAEKEKNDIRQKLDQSILENHTLQAKLDNTPVKNNSKAAKPGKIINLPWKLQFTSTFRDDNQGLIVLNTQWFDHLVAAEKASGSHVQKITDLQNEIKTLKAPVNADLTTVYSSLQGKLAHSKVFRDTKANIAVLTLGYFSELEKADKSKTAIQEQLDRCNSDGQLLKEQVSDLKSQLDQCLQHRNSVEEQTSNLQKQLLDGQQQRKHLEEQINLMSNNQASGSDLKKQLHDCMKQRQDRETELAGLQTQFNERLTDLEQRLDECLKHKQELEAKAQKGPSNNTSNAQANHEILELKKKLSASLQSKKDLEARINQDPGAVNASVTQIMNERDEAREESKLWREELETLQSLWNNLTKSNIDLQTQFADAQRLCADEKAQLQEQLDEAKQKEKDLQMKIVTNPDALQPYIIQVEAQRDSARGQRDAARNQIRDLQQQLTKAMTDCETEKNTLQAKLNSLSVNT